jgi:protein arginine N-methyltransferase 1
MVSDLRGRFPLHGAHVPAVIDARSRLLKPGGVQIPTRDRLFVGLARDDHQFRRLRRPWVENDFGLDLGVVFEHVINLSLGSNPGTTLAVGDGACWAEVDYTRTTDPNARGRVVLNAPAGAVFNALELWFEAELLPGIGYSTSPRDPVQVYGRTLLPLREQVTLGDDEVAEVSIDMRLMGSGYLTTWRVAVRDAAGETVRVNLAHSTFHASIMSMRDLGTKGSTPLPSPSPKSEAASTVLAGLSDGLGVGELARRVMDRFPGMFGSVSAAEAFVVDLVRLLR